MPHKIYIVEDEVNLNSILKMYLEKEGYQVESFLNGKSAMDKITDPPSLWVLDIMLPDINGYTILKKIKEFNSSTPVIYISARNQDLDRVIGLELGCDDYISKPFLPRELVIRVEKLIKLTYGDKPLIEAMEVGGYVVDKSTHLVTFNGSIIDLSNKEFELVLFMANNLNHAFPREQILNKVWGDNYFGSDRVVDDTIRRIRKKMPSLPIETIYGFGYRMVKK